MNGFDFEQYVAAVLERNGYTHVRVTQCSGDQGGDILARDPDGHQICFQCKYYSGGVGNKAIQEVYFAKAYYKCDLAGVITNSYFTKSAKEAASQVGVLLYDGDVLNRMVDRISTKDALKKDAWRKLKQNGAFFGMDQIVPNQNSEEKQRPIIIDILRGTLIILGILFGLSLACYFLYLFIH